MIRTNLMLLRSPSKSESSEQKGEGNEDVVEEVKVADENHEVVKPALGHREMNSTEWETDLMSKEKGSDEDQKWRTFLGDLKNTFSEYDVQRDRQLYNVAELSDWGQPDKPQGISVNSENFIDFLDKIRNCNMTEYESVKYINSTTDLQIEELNEVLSLTLNHKPTVRCAEPYINIKGNFVVLSEAMNNLNTNSHTDGSCSNFKADIAAGKYKWFKVFALNTAFFDTDLSFSGQNISAAIIAPDWKIIGRRSINLDNGDGSSPEVNDGSHSRNKRGHPEYTGVYENSFFGIGKNLKIISMDDKKVVNIVSEDEDNTKPGEDAIKSSEKDPNSNDGILNEVRCVEECDSNDWLDVFHYRIISLTSGTGLIEGDCVKEEYGDDSDNITILKLTQQSNIFEQNSNRTEAENYESGVGAPALNNRLESATKESSTLANIINEYKMYLRENINSRRDQCALHRFLALLNSNKDVRELYDIPAMIADFQGLEELFSKMGDKIDFSSFYRSLLETISEFAKDQKDILVSKENKKVLNFLYTATLGRIYYLRENNEKYLNIYLKDHLDDVKHNIKLIKGSEGTINKVDAINKYKDKYKSGIDEKIKKTQSLIEKQIIPEIDDINARIEKEINSLIEKFIALEEQAEKDSTKEKKIMKKLENALQRKGILNCVRIIGETITVLGPYGELTNSVIDKSSTVIESLKLKGKDKDKTLNVPLDVKSSIEALKEKIEKVSEQKIGYLNKLLNDFSEEINKNPEKLGDITSKIEQIKYKLKKVKDKELDNKHIRVLEKELEEIIKIKKVDLQEDEKSVDALNVIEKIEKIATFGSLFEETYDNVKEDAKKIAIFTMTIEKMGDKLQLLEEYENNIYDNTATMLQQLFENTKYIEAKFRSESHVALDVTKWHVQKSLKDMKIEIQNMKNSTEIKEDIRPNIEKLDEIMTALIHIYDRIQNYQELQNLSNYVSDVSSDEAREISIQDQQLASIANYLEYVIISNIVIEQYKSAVDYLKLWVFPLAQKYIDDHMLPSNLLLNNNIDNLVQTAVENLDKITEKIDLFADSIRDGDQYFQCGEFSSEDDSSQPFYVWKNEENRVAISNLLSGKEVVLKADINASPPGKDAIKFSEIDFRFKTENVTAQTKFSKILNKYMLYATHLGNSYYRTDNNISLITSDNLLIWYSLEKKAKMENMVHTKMKSGYLLLSPYSSWKVSLDSILVKNDFQALEKFKNKIDIELSGVGSYINTHSTFFGGYDSITSEVTDLSPIYTGVVHCRRSKHRSKRSVDGITEDRSFLTSDASIGKSSPINFLCNFLKTYVGSSLVISINQIFFREKTSFRNDYYEPFNEYSGTRNLGRTSLQNPEIRKASENDCKNEMIAQKPCMNFNVKFNESKHCSKPFLLSGQNSVNNYHSIHVPDFNCSLLLADLVTRTITGNKYSSPINEFSQFPREKPLGKISNTMVKTDCDFKYLLQCYQSEKENKRPRSWLGKLNGYKKAILQFLGLEENENSEEYVEDVPHLFA